MEDYEKKYKEAMARMESWARGEHPECFSEAQKAAEFVFPELKEDEDEKIKKSLIGYLKECRNNTRSEVMIDEYAKWIAWLEKRSQLKSVNSLDALNWNPASEIPTAHWEHNNSISPLYLVKCEGNQEGKPIIGYARYSFATDMWMVIHTTGHGIYKVIEWLDDGAEDNTAIEDNPKFRVGDTIKPKDGCHEPWEVKEVDMVGKKYRFNNGYVVDFSHEDAYELADETCKCGEENEDMVDLLIKIFEVSYPDGFYKANEIGTNDMRGVSSKTIISWLKSLKSRWKPSKQQMGALANACNGKILYLDYLNSLYNDLKKL